MLVFICFVLSDTLNIELKGEGWGGDRYITIYVLYFRNDTVSVEGNRDLAAWSVTGWHPWESRHLGRRVSRR